MNKIIRSNVFETNSSSSHSIALASGVPVLDTIETDECGNIVFEDTCFSWEIERVTDAKTKATYALISFRNDENKFEKIKNVIQEVTGCKG